MQRALLEGIQAGIALAGLWLILWLAAIGLQTPEPPEFLEWVRQPWQPPAASSSGVTFDLRACSHCPSFLVLERGFAGTGDYSPSALLALWSWPAVKMVWGPAEGPEVRELSPLAFFVAVACQWLLVGLLLRLFFYWLARRRMVA